MGCVNNYCSWGSNTAILKDKPYTATIYSNLISNQPFSNKTNNKLLPANSTLKGSEYLDKSCPSNNQSTDDVSNIDKKNIENPLPFVKIIPKKVLY